MDDVTAAKILIGCLDLTSLNKDDNDTKITKLCNKAVTPYGNVAAVCVYPKFVPLCRKLLHKTDIKVATVVNFPEGNATLEKLAEEIKSAKKQGADEIDIVFPYKEMLKGNTDICKKFIEFAVKETGSKHILKIILETGELKKTRLIKEAASICIQKGVGFIKTSTGKTDICATPEAANAVLETIKESKTATGFKASGGIKTIDDAKKYLILATLIMSGKWFGPHHFRIGASSLLDDLINVIERGY